MSMYQSTLFVTHFTVKCEWLHVKECLIPHLPLAVASAPSCQARQWKAVGAIPTGKLISVPSTVVRMSLTDTSRKIRGLSRILKVISAEKKTEFNIFVIQLIFIALLTSYIDNI